ncbi:MAG: HAD-IA family hydrolase [Solobacterium sp.]|nr:HAD-IA family hydrolase [Solobacterium sp.]
MNTERAINGVFFDLGWTLEYHAGEDWLLTPCFLHHAQQSQFHKIDPVLRKQAIADAYRPLTTRHKMNDCEEERVRFTEFYTDLNRSLSLGFSQEVIEEIAWDHTYNFSNYILFDSTRETLKTLKNHGYRVGVISDTWPSTVPQQKEAGLWDYYDFAVLSCDLGVMKPNPLMYETALEAMKLPPEETIYVDDLVLSLDKASEYGIHGVCSIAQNPESPVSSYPCVKEPAEVLTLLKQINGGRL